MTTTPPKRSNESAKSLKLSEIAQLVGGELVGDRNLVITGVAGIKEAQKGDITFVANVKYLPFLRQTRASAVIAASGVDAGALALVRTENPSQAFTKVVTFFMPAPPESVQGAHPSAVVSKGAYLGERVSIGAHAVIEEGVRLGDDSIIGAGCVISRGSTIGRRSRLYAQVTVREDVRIGTRPFATVCPPQTAREPLTRRPEQ